MALSRRRFLRHTVAVGPVAMVLFTEVDAVWAQGGEECTLPTPPTPVRFIPNEPKVVARISALQMADPSRATQLKQFREAIGMVRALPPTNVLSWTKLVAQHCINCASSNTNNIHYDWQFLPWHRALLYFLERSMRQMSGNDDLRLTYWDWENASSRVLPSIYAPTGQPLYWSGRGDLNARWWPLTDDQVDVQGILALPDWKTFGGTSVQRTPTPAAYGGPHANVHNNFKLNGDMRNLQYSPRDPVFYAHHGNIDRLWASWAELPGHNNPDFGDAKVYFYDGNAKNPVWSYVLMNDLRDPAKLGYSYSTLMQPEATQAKLRSFPMASLKQGKMQLKADIMDQVKQDGPDFLVLENIQNIGKMAHDVREFGVFVGAAAAGTVVAQAKNFLGRVTRVLGGDHHHDGPLTAVLRVTGKLGALIANDTMTADLTLAPLDDEGKTSSAAVPLEADNVSVIS